jgi:hypothetical protein
MDRNNTIDVTELRKLSDRLFARLEESGVRQVRVQSPYYWTAFADQAFDVEKQPKLVICDDIRDLRRDAGAPAEEAIAFWHGFHHLSGLIAFLAEADMAGRLKPEGEGARA